LVQIEPSLDANTWEKREERYARKFNAGRRYIPTLFEELAVPSDIEQIALLVFAGGERTTLGGGRILLIKDFMRDILAQIRGRRLNSAAIPEQYPLLRTLQYAAQYWSLPANLPLINS
jgi:hypothetical protein